MTSTTLAALPAEHRERLMSLARDASFGSGARLFEEGRHADRFWVIETGTVALDLRVPGRRAAVIESLTHGELVGWSWHFPPYVWQLGAEATSPVRDPRVRRRRRADAVRPGSGVRPCGRLLGRTRGRRPAALGPCPPPRPLRPVRQRKRVTGHRARRRTAGSPDRSLRLARFGRRGQRGRVGATAE
jgi:hypothetical protein